MKKILTNEDVLLLATVQVAAPQFTYLSANLRNIRDYDVQKAIRDNDPILKAEAQRIIESIKATFGEKFNNNDPKIREIIEKESTIKLSTVKLTEDKIRSFQPNWDMMNCLEFIIE